MDMTVAQSFIAVVAILVLVTVIGIIWDWNKPKKPRDEDRAEDRDY